MSGILTSRTSESKEVLKPLIGKVIQFKTETGLGKLRITDPVLARAVDFNINDTCTESYNLLASGAWRGATVYIKDFNEDEAGNLSAFCVYCKDCYDEESKGATRVWSPKENEANPDATATPTATPIATLAATPTATPAATLAATPTTLAADTQQLIEEALKGEKEKSDNLAKKIEEEKKARELLDANFATQQKAFQEAMIKFQETMAAQQKAFIEQIAVIRDENISLRTTLEAQAQKMDEIIKSIKKLQTGNYTRSVNVSPRNS